MTFLRHLLVFLAACAVAQAQLGPGNTPVRKFRLPIFNKEGFRISLLEGDQAEAVSPQEIRLSEMRFSLFSGDEAATLDTTLLAPHAIVRIPEPEHYVVEGPGPVRLIRDDLDVAGEGWLYNHTQKKLSIRKNVIVIFRSELKDLLK